MIKVTFPSDIFSIPYDSLPARGPNGPDILEDTIQYFENFKGDILKFFSKICAVSPICSSNSSYSSDVSETLMLFFKLLCELPEPFLPSSAMMLYSESPSLTSAQQVVANLASNKRTLFKRFIQLLKDILKESIFPLEFDRILGSAFAHQQTHFFFDLLTKQNCSSLCFPFSRMKSFLPEEPPNLYPEIEIDELIDYTKVNVEVLPELLVAPSQTVAEQLSELYNNTKIQARSFGISDETFESIDNIPIKEAEKYRSELKSILLQFERDISALIKRKPVKSDKTPLSSLYRIHMKLRNKCRIVSKRDELIIEKKKLQRELNDYRTEFEEKYGRKISSAVDKAPVAVKYQRYKVIKEELAKLSKKTTH